MSDFTITPLERKKNGKVQTLKALAVFNNTDLMLRLDEYMERYQTLKNLEAELAPETSFFKELMGSEEADLLVRQHSLDKDVMGYTRSTTVSTKWAKVVEDYKALLLDQLSRIFKWKKPDPIKAYKELIRLMEDLQDEFTVSSSKEILRPQKLK